MPTNDTTTDDRSTATLTLTARGPAVCVIAHTTDDLAVTESTDVTLEAEMEIDAGELNTLGDVHKQGAVLLPNTVGEHVADQCSDTDATYRTSGNWELTLAGTVDDWVLVAVQAAKDRRSPTVSKARIATTACHILDSLAEYGDDRPLLAMLDLIDHYDVADFERESVLERYREGDVPAVAPPEEVETDA